MSKRTSVTIPATLFTVEEMAFFCSTIVLRTIIIVVIPAIAEVIVSIKITAMSIIQFLVVVVISLVFVIVVVIVVLVMLLVYSIIVYVILISNVSMVVVASRYICISLSTVQLRLLDFQCIYTLLESFFRRFFPLIICKAPPIGLF